MRSGRGCAGWVRGRRCRVGRCAGRASPRSNTSVLPCFWGAPCIRSVGFVRGVGGATTPRSDRLWAAKCERPERASSRVCTQECETCTPCYGCESCLITNVVEREQLQPLPCCEATTRINYPQYSAPAACPPVEPSPAPLGKYPALLPALLDVCGARADWDWYLVGKLNTDPSALTPLL